MNFVGTSVPLTLNMQMLENEETHNELFFQMKDTDEHIGLVTVNKQDLNYASFGWKVQQQIDAFFEKHIFVKEYFHFADENQDGILEIDQFLLSVEELEFD